MFLSRREWLFVLDIAGPPDARIQMESVYQERSRDMRRLLAVVVALAAGCASQPTELGRLPAPELAAAHVRPNNGEDFRLRVGEIAASEDETFFVTFRAVASDSRCPTDVACVWAGNAEVVIGTAAAGERWAPRTLNTAGDTIEVIVGDHAVRLLDIDPEPRSDEAIPTSSYSALLRITRWPPEARSTRAQLVARDTER